MNLPDQASEAIAAKLAASAQWGGAGTAIVGGATAHWVAAIGGLILGVAGFILNWYFKQQHLELARSRAKADPDE